MKRTATGNVRWFLVLWLFVLSAVSYLDRVNISVAGSSIAADFHLTDVQLGWVFSAFLWGYALFQTPGGWLADALASCPYRRSRLVGYLHGSDRRGHSENEGCGLCLCDGALSSRRGRSDSLPRIQPVCLALDSHAGTRRGQWPDLRGSRRGCGFRTRRGHLHHHPLRLALVVLD